MRVVVYSTKPYDQTFLEAANRDRAHELVFIDSRLGPQTAALAAGGSAVCAFVNDQLDADVIAQLSNQGTRFIALRSAGYNHVDLRAAAKHGIQVARVPAYSPHAVAEHTLALMLTLIRRIHRAYNRVREGNFALDGLLGFDLHGKTVGVVGTGRIGSIVATILRGFGCHVLAFDQRTNPVCTQVDVEYCELNELLTRADVITLHCPLTPDTHHLVRAETIAQMKRGVMVVNTSRGALVDASALIDGLKSGQVGAVALDVYEEEADYFFENLSNQVLVDDVLARLLTFHNVLITSHQAFFTTEALNNIAETTMANIDGFANGSVPQANRLEASL